MMRSNARMIRAAGQGHAHADLQTFTVAVVDNVQQTEALPVAELCSGQANPDTELGGMPEFSTAQFDHSIHTSDLRFRKK